MDESGRNGVGQEMEGGDVGETWETLSRSRDPPTDFKLDEDLDMEGDKGRETEALSRLSDSQIGDLDEDQDVEDDQGGETEETASWSSLHDPQPHDLNEDQDMEGDMGEKTVETSSRLIDSQIGDLADDQAVQGANGTEKQEFESILPQCHKPARVSLVAPPLPRPTPSQNRVEEHFETIRPRRHNPARVKVIVPPPPRSTSSENWVGKRKHHPDSPPTSERK